MKKPNEVAVLPAKRRWFRSWRWRIALLLLLLLAGVAWGLQRHVVGVARPFQRLPGNAPFAECILVPGARIDAEGRPYPMLVDRLAAAQDLFVRGKANRIIVSGRGGGGLAVDEVGAMHRWLAEHGVPERAIVDDGLGLRTIDSLRRCRDEYSYESVLVVSNSFHVSRAIFLGRKCGLDVYGVAAPALTEYSTAVMWKNHGRELFARVRACLDVYVFGVCD